VVLDDDPAILRTIGSLAGRMGAEVIACSSLADFEGALAIAAADTILIDLMMPEIDGLDVLSRLDPIPGAAIHVMTGADRRTIEASREVLAASAIEIAGFLQKPFAASDLLGCDSLQGHLFSRAIPAAQAADWLVTGCPREAA